MSRILARLTRGFALRPQRSGQVVFECRHCGETVDSETVECPACGRAEIGRYELSGSG
jgi:predicted RNA-binding Zn-ribbon protein involved in translation (DUF1610 family)